VLRLLRERLLVSLAPDAVSWLKLGGYTSTVIARHTAQADPVFGQEPWQGAVAALRATAEAWRKDAVAVSIVLSNHFARYVLVPPGVKVSGTEEEHALARFYFSKVHGERSRAWDVRLSDAAPNAPRLACAVDSALLEALRACFPPKGRPQLVSVQPLLMSGFNFWRRQFPAAGAWFLLVEPERACLGLFSGRSWVAVQNAKGHFPDEQAWADLLDRERLRTNLDCVPDTVLVHAPATSGVPHASGTWKLQRLQTALPAGLSPNRDSAYLTALTAA